jgi:hypothetical protein
VAGATLFWDLSDLDGAGAGVTGTPFAADNVRVSPSGAGLGTGTCNVIKCAANAICQDAYQHPDDTATKVSASARPLSGSLNIGIITNLLLFSPVPPIQEP